MKKAFGCIYSFLYYSFYGLMTIISIIVLLLSIIWSNGEMRGGTFATVLVSFAFFLLGFIKLGARSFRRYLCAPGKRFQKPINLLSSFLMYNLLIISTALYLSNISIDSEVLNGGDNFPAFVGFVIQIIVWFVPVMLIWMLHNNIMVIGVKDFLRNLRGFFPTYAGAFFTYRLAVMLFTMIGTVILLAVANGFGGDLVTQGYFYYILDGSLDSADAAGFLSGDGAFIGGLTAASSYMVLSEMALESLTENERSTFLSSLKKMFFSKDSLQLLIMTVICIVVSAIPLPEWDSEARFTSDLWSGLASEYLPIIILLAVMGLGWLVSLISFVVKTKFLPFLLNFFTLYFVEMIIPIPSLTNAGTVFFAIGAILLRVIVFSVISMMIATLDYALLTQKRIQQSSTDASGKTDLTDLTFAQVGVGLAFLYIGRKDIMKSLGAKAIDGVRQKIQK